MYFVACPIMVYHHKICFRLYYVSVLPHIRKSTEDDKTKIGNAILIMEENYGQYFFLH